jgi:hypothetical protein
MYEIRSGKRVVQVNAKTLTKDQSIEAASDIVQGLVKIANPSHSGAKNPRSVVIVGIRGSAKNAKPVEVTALGHRRENVDVRELLAA